MGYIINVDGAQIFFKVALRQVSGDKFGIYSLFGFTKSFEVNHTCMFCIMHREVMRKSYFEIEELLR